MRVFKAAADRRSRIERDEKVLSTSLTRRTGRNAIFNLFGFAYSSALAFVVIPIVVRHLGPERYGIFALAGTLLGFLGILNLGLGTSLLKFLAEELATDSRAQTTRVFGASLVFYGAIGLLGMVVAIVIGVFFTTAIFNLSPGSVPAARFTFVVAGVAFLVVMLTKPFSVLLYALQRYDVQTKASVVLATLSAAATLGLLFLGYGIRALVLLGLAIDVASLLVFVGLGRRLAAGIPLRPRIDVRTLRRIFTFSGFIFIANIGGLVLAEFDRLMIGALASVALVAFYAVPIGIASRINSAVVSLASIALPVSSDLFARNDLERVRLLYVRGTRFVTMFLLSLSIPIVVFTHKILLYWIGPTYAARSGDVLRILVATYVCIALTVIPYNLVVGSGKPQAAALFNALMAVLNVVLVVVLVPPFGIKGAAVAFLASTAPFPFFVRYVERRILGLRKSPWPSTALRLVVPAAAQTAICLALLPVASNLGTLVAILVVSAPVLVGVYWLLVADPEEKGLMLALVRGR